MNCPYCGIPNVERLHDSIHGHWCPGFQQAERAQGVPARNERRAYPEAAPMQMQHVADEWLAWVESLPTTMEV